MTSKSNVVERAILILNIDHIERLHAISQAIRTASSRTKTRLLIAIFHRDFDKAHGTGRWAAVQKLLTHAYIEATTVAQEQEKILLQVDVILHGFSASGLADIPSLLDEWQEVLYLGDYIAGPYRE